MALLPWDRNFALYTLSWLQLVPICCMLLLSAKSATQCLHKCMALCNDNGIAQWGD